MIPAFRKFLIDFKATPYVRMGQHFMNTYICTDKELEQQNLYNERNEERCRMLIEQWLTNHNYFDELPHKVN